MSHTLKATVPLTDHARVETIARELKYEVLGQRQHRLFDGTVVDGLVLKIPGWREEVVVGKDGTVRYDNFGGSWGKIDPLEQLVQAYVAGSAIEAVNNGAFGPGAVLVDQSVAENDDILLTIEV